MAAAALLVPGGGVAIGLDEELDVELDVMVDELEEDELELEEPP